LQSLALDTRILAGMTIIFTLLENLAQSPALIPIARFPQCGFWLFANNNLRLWRSNFVLYDGK
jgi:hypothetical protein